MELSSMVYSFSSAIQSGDMTVPEVCAFLRDECDVTALEIMHRRVEPVGVGELMKMLDDLGSSVVCYIGSGDFVQKTDDEQQPAIDAVKAAIDNSAEMGCKLMLITTGGCKPDIPAPEARKRIAAGLQRVIPHAKDAGITVTIEDVGSPAAPYGTSSDMLEMCDLVGPDLKLTYDNGNFFTRAEDPNAAMERVWDKVVHVHCKDWRKLPLDAEQGFIGSDGNRYVGEVCGEGEMDYAANIAEIKRRGYTGYLSFEYEGKGDPKEAARKGLANIRALL